MKAFTIFIYAALLLSFVSFSFSSTNMSEAIPAHTRKISDRLEELQLLAPRLESAIEYTKTEVTRLKAVLKSYSSTDQSGVPAKAAKEEHEKYVALNTVLTTGMDQVVKAIEAYEVYEAAEVTARSPVVSGVSAALGSTLDPEAALKEADETYNKIADLEALKAGLEEAEERKGSQLKEAEEGKGSQLKEAEERKGSQLKEAEERKGPQLKMFIAKIFVGAIVVSGVGALGYTYFGPETVSEVLEEAEEMLEEKKPVQKKIDVSAKGGSKVKVDTKKPTGKLNAKPKRGQNQTKAK